MMTLCMLVLAQAPPAKSPQVQVVPKVEPVKPLQVPTAVGKSVVLSSDVAVIWESCDTTGSVELFPRDDKKTVVFVASAPGRYVVLAQPAEGPATKTEVIVGIPDPSPVVPPSPVDPLPAKLKAAFDADSLQLDLRRKGVENLIVVYAQAAKVIADPSIPSIAEHSKRVKAVSDQMFADDKLSPDALAGVRKAVADELRIAFPNGPPNELTADVRSQISSIYLRAAAGLKPILNTK